MRGAKSEVYLKVKDKLKISLLFAALWFSFSLYVALPWSAQLSEIMPVFLAWFLIAGIALIPGIALSFLASSLILDLRPKYIIPDELPSLSILVAAYNEETNIEGTIESICKQEYKGKVEIIIIDDGSTDNTCKAVNAYIEKGDCSFDISVIKIPENSGKANALNCGLESAKYDLIMTIDADSVLFGKSLAIIVTNLIYGPPNTAAVAGTVLAHNSRENIITKMQEWDYFHGISVIKRVQSLLQGVLVAQGAFSVYHKHIIKRMGGWSHTVGEDIVLTWGLLEKGYRVGYSENAFVFTNVPNTYSAFFRQRKRWSRGLIEAFKQHPKVITTLRPNSIFIWLNVLFPYLDLIYMFVFLPGVIAAVFFQNYAIVGLMTLLLLPLAVLINWAMFFKQNAIFKSYGLKVRHNIIGFTIYLFFYQALMSPACVFGYLSEIFKMKKNGKQNNHNFIFNAASHGFTAKSCACKPHGFRKLFFR